jgi:hypothetical protein
LSPTWITSGTHVLLPPRATKPVPSSGLMASRIAAIDPGVLLDATNGSPWLTYASYFGYIRLVELDPKTGKRLHPDRAPINRHQLGSVRDHLPRWLV